MADVREEHEKKKKRQACHLDSGCKARYRRKTPRKQLVKWASVLFVYINARGPSALTVLTTVVKACTRAQHTFNRFLRVLLLPESTGSAAGETCS